METTTTLPETCQACGQPVITAYDGQVRRSFDEQDGDPRYVIGLGRLSDEDDELDIRAPIATRVTLAASNAAYRRHRCPLELPRQDSLVWEQTTSSNVARVAHVEQTGDLYVTFQNGSSYRYRDMPASVVSELMKADSKGGFLAKSVKPHFEVERVTFTE